MGCCGGEKRPGDEQGAFAREAQRQADDLANLRTNGRVRACAKCPDWRGPWKCGRFPIGTAYRRALLDLAGACPAGLWMTDP